MGSTILALPPSSPRTLVGIHHCGCCGVRQMHVWPLDMTVTKFECPSCRHMAGEQDGPAIEAHPLSEPAQIMAWLVESERMRCKTLGN